MSEKRFTALGSTHLRDNETGKEFYAPCEWDLLELLNNLHEENQHLTNIIDCLEKGSCRSIDSFLDTYCTEEMLKEFDLE